jgi:solute carrier family 25 carnitine/acylcarnitine transporter 20/29
MRKIWAQRGIAGIFKGQVATFGREGLGYASYFLCYETLMQREMLAKGLKREEIHASHAVLYGAAAGYAVSPLPLGDQGPVGNDMLIVCLGN